MDLFLALIRLNLRCAAALCVEDCFVVSLHPPPASSVIPLQHVEDSLTERTIFLLCVFIMPSTAKSPSKPRFVSLAVIKINKGISINSSSLSVQEIVTGRKNLG
uniref:Secreted protein n=1 Tax=Taeniopygia guttata TaxID=59729 RepID=A0A674HHM8_TAEGU